MARLSVLVALASLGLVACFAPQLDEAQFDCSQGRCPDGFVCSGAPAFKCVSSPDVALDLGVTPDRLDGPTDAPAADDGPVSPVDVADLIDTVSPDTSPDMPGPDLPAGEVFRVTEGPNASLTGVTLDTHIDQNGAAVTHGADGALEVNGVAGEQQSTLIQWDLATLAGRQVISATLRVYVLIARDQIRFHEVLVPWDSTATYSEAITGTPWPTPGCEAGCRSEKPVLIAEFLQGDAADSVELDPALVQRWIDDAPSNHGLMLRLESTDGAGQARFLSSEHLTFPERRPVLELVLER